MPTIWLLGSSDYSARLAAEKGMPYVFAHHFSGSGTAEALALYRGSFRPSPELAEPRTFLTVNVVGRRRPTRRRAGWPCPSCRRCSALRTGGELQPQRLVEEAEKVELPPAHLDLMDAMAQRWVIGSPATARARIAELAATYGVDEVMVHPVAGAFTGHRPRPQPRARGDAPRLLGADRSAHRIRVSTAVSDVNWRVGPTWVCSVVPRGCPEAR